MPRKLATLDADDLIRSYLEGEPEQAIAKRLGVSRTPVRRLLLAHGVPIRGIGEANAIRMGRMSPDERRQLASKANAARRGQRDTVATITARGHARALGLEHSRRVQQPIETVVADLLRARGISPTAQQAVDSYNLDLSVGAVAVEVHRGPNNPMGQTHLRKRAEHLLNRGWHVYYLWLDWSNEITDTATDDLVAFLQRTERSPAAPREYRVVRGSGKVKATGCRDLDQFPLVPPAVASLD